jgi:uncharacterized protein
MLLNTIKEDINTSLKKGEKVRLETMRQLLSAVRYAAIAKYGNGWETSVGDKDVEDVIKKQVKTHKESINAFESANRPDLVKKEQAELAVLETMVPAELSDTQINKIIAEVVGGGEKNFGLLMGQVMKKVAGLADGARVSSLLKKTLESDN